MSHENREDGYVEVEKLLQDELAEERLEKRELEVALERVEEREKRTEEALRREERRHREERFFLVFLINGEDVKVETPPSELLKKSVEKALEESGNTGRREIQEWEVRDARGVLLDMARRIETLGLTRGSQLFLSLKVGAGG